MPAARMLATEQGTRFGLIAGVRVRSSSKATSSASMVAEPPLRWFAAIPHRLGGGYLFWNRYAIYRAKSFLGPLTPLVSTNLELSTVSFGPRAALVTNSEGERYGLDLQTGRRVPPEPVGVIDIAVLTNGRAAAILEGGTTMASRDGGATWTDISKQVLGPPLELSEEQGALWVFDETSAYRIDGPDTVLRFDSVPTTRTGDRIDPRWGSGLPPREAAVERGLMLSAHRAIVAKEGNVAIVDMLQGEIIDFVAGVLPPNLSCIAELLRTDILFLCKSGDRNAVLRYSTETREAVLEHAFTGPAHFHSDGESSLLFPSSCSGVGADSAVCVRTEHGWEELDVLGALETSSRAGRADSDDRHVLSWIPRPDGASAFVTGRDGGVLDLRTGQLRKFPRETMTRVEKQGAPHRSGGIVERRFRAASDGRILGWGKGGSFSVSRTGVLSLSPFSFPSLAVAGAMAMGRSRTGRLWQTTNWGQNWSEVRGPAEGAVAPPLSRCGLAGCVAGGWLRMGWPLRAPEPASRADVADKPPLEPGVAKPSLVCKPAGPRKVASVSLDDQHSYGLGARRLPAFRGQRESYWGLLWHEVATPWAQHDRETALRGIVHGPLPSGDLSGGNMQFPGTAAERSLQRDYWYVPMFAPTAPVKKHSISLGDLWDSSLTTGGSFLPFDADMDDAGIAMPVLTEPGKPVGLVTMPSNGPSVWLAEHAKPQPLSLGPRSDYIAPLSAAQVGQELSMVVFDEDENLIRVLQMHGGSSTELSSFATDVDGVGFHWLGVGPNDELAVIRVPSFVMPTESSPAVAIVAGQSPRALAPWDRLVPATAPACQRPGGYRTIVQTFMPWVTVGSSQEQDFDQGTFALVRWTEDVVCVEALETELKYEDGDWDYGMLSRLVVRFSPRPSAGLVGLTPGAELRQPMTCRLVPASENDPMPTRPYD